MSDQRPNDVIGLPSLVEERAQETHAEGWISARVELFAAREEALLGLCTTSMRLTTRLGEALADGLRAIRKSEAREPEPTFGGD